MDLLNSQAYFSIRKYEFQHTFLTNTNLFMTV